MAFLKDLNGFKQQDMPKESRFVGKKVIGKHIYYKTMEISTFFDTINQTNIEYKITKREGIDLNRIEEIEKKLEITLPEELKEFYQFTNGIEGDESDFNFNIIPLERIEKEIDYQGEYLVFAEYLIYCDTFGLEIDKTNINKYKIFTWSQTTNDIEYRRIYKTDSLTEFIGLYCELGTFGLFYGKEFKTPKSNSLKASSSKLQLLISRIKLWVKQFS